MQNNVCLFVADSNGNYPVPASKGGAVSTLVELLVKGNNKKNLINMSVVSYYDEKAYELSKKYNNINFIWINIPKAIKKFDKLLLWTVTYLTKLKAESFKSIPSLIYYTWKSTLLLKEHNYDTIVLEHNIPMVWMIRWSGFKGRYFHHLHNIPRTNAKCRKGLDSCYRFLCISQYMANDIMKETSPIGPVINNKIKLLYNCIDTNLFKPIRNEENIFKKEDFGINPTSKVLLFTGRITWEKGVDKVVESLKYIKCKDVELLIVGAFMIDDEKDPYSKRLKELCHTFKHKIHYTGYIEHNKLPFIYNLADISVLPSMWEEPAGLTMLEAMACGTPLITTKSGGIPEYVGDSAILLSRNDTLPQEIAFNVDLLLMNNNIYNSMSNKGIKRVNDLFSCDDYIDKFYEIVCE